MKRTSKSPHSDDGDARHAFTPDHADFKGMLAVGDHRGNPAVEEIVMFNAPVARLELLTDRKVDGLEMRFKQAEVCGR